jgi:molecular chaperone HtpG
MDRSLEKLLQGSGRMVNASKPILEINPRNALIAALSQLGEGDTSFKEDAAHLLFDEARVLDGDKPVDPRKFSDRLARLMSRGLPKG